MPDHEPITEDFITELNADGAIVWEFADSKRIGPTSQWQLTPTMCEMLRVEKDYVRRWLD